MRFKMINGSDIECVVTEEEMRLYGLGINDIFSNTKKAQYFLNEILDLVEEETGYFIGSGAKTVQAVCLPGNAVALTFSDKDETAKARGAAEARMQRVVLLFDTIKGAAVFARLLDVSRYEDAVFYKEKNVFYLVADLNKNDVSEIDRFLAAAFEYADGVAEDEWRARYLEEHAAVLVAGHALGVLAET